MLLLRLSVLVSLALLTACASSPQYAQLELQQPAGLERVARIDDLPFFPQDRYQCGPAALATLLVHRGIVTTADALVDKVYVPARQGSLQIEMKAAARSYALLPYELEPALQDLLREVAAGNPVLVMQNLGLDFAPQWHYAVVKGYDLNRGDLILNSGEIEDYSVSIATFERTWQRAKHWAVVVTAAHELPATASSARYFATVADMEESNAQLPTLRTAYESGLSRWPEDRNLLMGLANLQLADANFSSAATLFNRVVSLYPDYGPAHNNLAVALIELSEFERASSHIERALSSEDSTGDDFREHYLQTRHKLLQARQ